MNIFEYLFTYLLHVLELFYFAFHFAQVIRFERIYGTRKKNEETYLCYGCLYPVLDQETNKKIVLSILCAKWNAK